MKKIFQSKTIWVAALMFVSGGIMALESSYPAVGFLVMVKAIIDIILRLITTEQVKAQ